LLIDHIVEDLGRVVALREYFAVDHRPWPLGGPPSDYHARVKANAGLAFAAAYGGTPVDYEALLAFFALPAGYVDTAEDAIAVLHHSLGIYLAEDALGPVFEPAPGKLVATRTLAEDLVIARTGRINSYGALCNLFSLTEWMVGSDVAAGLAARKRDERAA
jgi:hypothetical protein